MNNPSRRTFSAAITREALGEGKDAWMLFSSPDIPGFFLCYEDQEKSYGLIEPLACFMIWRNLKKFVALQSLDWELLRETGMAVAAFAEYDKHPGGKDPDLKEYGSLIKPPGKKYRIFLPSVRIKGEEMFPETMLHRIMLKSNVKQKNLQ